MRNVVAYEFLSLDGVAEQPDAFVSDFDDVMRENLARVIGSQDTVLLGRRTYDEWAGYWPTSTIEPFASFINPVEKFVATSTPLDPEWSSSSVIEGDLASFVGDLKQQEGGDIGIHGSISVAQSLLEANLLDELRLVIAPAVQLSGRRLFETTTPSRLALTRTVTSPTGSLLVDYQVSR